MTEPTDPAAALLRDVPIRARLRADETGLHELVFKRDVLAALSAHLDADLAGRAAGRARFCRDRGEIKSPEIIEALLAQNAALRAERDAQRRDLEKTIRNQRAELRRLQALERVHWQSVERWRGTREGLEGKVKAAEAERDALRAERDALVNEAVLSKAAYEGVSSLLLSVQQDCIKERQRADRLEAAIRELRHRWYLGDLEEKDFTAALKGDDHE